jgi:hypothetical protein
MNNINKKNSIFFVYIKKYSLSACQPKRQAVERDGSIKPSPVQTKDSNNYI